MAVVYMVAKLVSALLTVLEAAMFIRVILSWIPAWGSSAFGDLVYTVTETVVAPVRALADRFGWFRGSPIDFPFMIAYVLLFVVQSVISAATVALF